MPYWSVGAGDEGVEPDEGEQPHPAGPPALLEGASGVFCDEAKTVPAAAAVDVKTLYAKIGELALENDFLAGALNKAGLLSARK